MQEGRFVKLLYSIVLFIVTIIIWTQIYQAQFLDYDENWGSLISAFLVSVCSFFVLIFIWLNWRGIILACKWQTFLFLLLSSPLTVVGVVFNYDFFFRATLRV